MTLLPPVARQLLLLSATVLLGLRSDPHDILQVYKYGSVVPSLCTTTQPLRTRFTNILGASFS
jgi:hypothetical protein